MHRSLAAFFAVLFLAMPQAQACTVCFGNPDSPLSKGVAVGVLFLLGVIGGVLIAIGVTAYRWSKRAKQLEAEQSSFHALH